MSYRALAAAILGVLLAGFAPPLFAQQAFFQLATQAKAWRWTTGAGLGLLLAPGEIGRERNASGGHEELIARLSDGMALGFQVGLEGRFGGLELRGVSGGRAVEVKNEFGVAFPDHGSRPLAWNGHVLVYPLAPLQRRSRPVRPFLTAGLGGMLLSVDLDNVKGQTLYHPFHWNLGAGVRIAASPDNIPSWTPTFIELRVERFRVWRIRPLRGFDAVAATLGLGMRL